ncbi:MAG: hypothetical protein RJB66_1539 [Pseudomonadota bacterium]|jgi:hypothetical protein
MQLKKSNVISFILFSKLFVLHLSFAFAGQTSLPLSGSASGFQATCSLPWGGTISEAQTKEISLLNTPHFRECKYEWNCNCGL